MSIIKTVEELFNDEKACKAVCDEYMREPVVDVGKLVASWMACLDVNGRALAQASVLGKQ